MSTFLLTGGRAPATLDLARLLADAGHRVLVAESLPGHLCRRSRAVSRCFDVPAPVADPDGFVAALAAIARAEGVDMLVPTCEEAFWVARGRAALAEACHPLVAPLDALRRLHDKGAFSTWLADLGLPTPATWRLEGPDDLAQVRAGPAAGRKLVLKPAFSRFATRVAFLAAEAPTPPCPASPAEPWVAQAFVAGRHVSTWGVAHHGRLTAHAAYAAGFTAGVGACIEFRPEPDPAIQAWVARLAAAAGHHGQLAFDLVVGDDGTLWPLECNPRATSGIHLFGPADGLAEALLGTAPAVATPRPDARAMLGLAMAIYGLPAALAEGRLPAWLGTVATARDVVFRPDDPLPALDQVGAYAGFVAEAVRHGVPVMAATTRDIEWNGQP